MSYIIRDKLFNLLDFYKENYYSNSQINYIVDTIQIQLFSAFIINHAEDLCKFGLSVYSLENTTTQIHVSYYMQKLKVNEFQLHSLRFAADIKTISQELPDISDKYLFRHCCFELYESILRLSLDYLKVKLV